MIGKSVGKKELSKEESERRKEIHIRMTGKLIAWPVNIIMSVILFVEIFFDIIPAINCIGLAMYYDHYVGINYNAYDCYFTLPFMALDVMVLLFGVFGIYFFGTVIADKAESVVRYLYERKEKKKV